MPLFEASGVEIKMDLNKLCSKFGSDCGWCMLLVEEEKMQAALQS